MTVGERIRIIRYEATDKKLSMAAFAKMIGVSAGAVSQWETGDKNPSRSIISLICKTFHIDEDWLLNGKGEMKTPLTREAEIAELASKLYGADPNSFEYKVAMYLKDLSFEDWRRFEALLRDMSEKLL